jgi:hypothetical protein
MEARLTEFSYGYCVTEELANGTGPGFKAAPYFPSLYAEGKEGGGFDVQLGSALFLQFKLSDELTRSYATEAKLGLLNPTFFRFSLHRRDRSTQHQMLIELEAVKGNQVYYIAPGFAQLVSLDSAYQGRTVVSESALFSPSDIGPLVDDGYHTVAFRLDNAVGWFLSKPKEIPVRHQRELLKKALTKPTAPKSRLAQEWLTGLAEKMKSIAAQHSKAEVQSPNRKLRSRDNADPLNEVEYLARTRFGCELFLLAQPHK